MFERVSFIRMVRWMDGGILWPFTTVYDPSLPPLLSPHFLFVLRAFSPIPTTTRPTSCISSISRFK